MTHGVVWIPFFIVDHSWVFCTARAVISDVPVLLLRQPTVALHPPWGPFLESPENFSDPKAILKTPTRLLCKAGLFFSYVLKGWKIKIIISFVPIDASVLTIERKLFHLNCAR